ncbi:phosphoesterase RecJ domain-containing protein [Evansella caseinilytica]|uniref:Phosphoesterase RecJ domain-containing protein n=1 Tax=Evansella caseinilytica TaxID=1503961 RepID=A0A1H3TZL6_9BACI|nr:bifunctional oligoribonuclease/PAP phosphatase NrnA [Evansella caseinilytica]SDZ54709.1 phosphoesterase RecJ domain-containing protein [Evansella caseinilytica]
MKKLIYEKIKAWDSIIIHRHVRPDPDAYGSQAGLKELINLHFPEKKVYLAGDHDPSLTFLATMDEIADNIFAQSLIIVCDTANIERIDDNRYEKGRFLIKIDHHPEVDPYGDLSWVDTEASSTSEMICELSAEFSEAEKNLSDEAARLLYGGIVGDTGRFRYPSTTQKTFFWAGQLVQYRFSISELYDKMYASSLAVIRLEGYVLSSVEVRPSGAGVVYLPKEKLEEFGVTSRDAASIVNAFSTLEGLKAWVFFVEEEDVIRVRLRSKGPEIHKLAGSYHGGGHPLASGAHVTSWEEADRLLAELDDICRTK